MADKLSFALVSPERELFNGDVDHVVVPGAEGEFGVLPNHAPAMSVIKPGALRVINDGAERRRRTQKGEGAPRAARRGDGAARGGRADHGSRVDQVSAGHFL